MRCVVLASAIVAAAALGSSRPGHAYEFRVAASTIGQGYQVRLLRFSEPDRFLNRRRLTQTLSLELWDLASASLDPIPSGPAPFDLYFTSSFRFDHDYGEYTAGEIEWTEAGFPFDDPATTVVGELGEETVQLDVPYAYLGGRDLFGFLDFRLGRQLDVETWDFTSFDGLAVVAHTPWFLDVELQGGLVVRSASLFGAVDHEPDGTQGSDCRVFESASGAWISRADCAQREALMPTFAAAVSSAGLHNVHARLAYRRAMSRPADIYPDGVDGWGVNEEKLTADARAELGPVAPFLAARWNFVLGQVDEAAAGLRLALGPLAFTPEASLSTPSFEADSIFNVFAAEPYRDLTGTLEGRFGAWSGWSRGFYRRFDSDVDDEGAGGGELGVRWRQGRDRVRLVTRHEDGFGGRRTAGDASGTWAWRRFDLEGRLTLVDYTDPDSERDGTSLGVQAGARFPLAPGAALHVLGEENFSDEIGQRFRLLVVLDLAYVPEL